MDTAQEIKDGDDDSARKTKTKAEPKSDSQIKKDLEKLEKKVDDITALDDKKLQNMKSDKLKSIDEKITELKESGATDEQLQKITGDVGSVKERKSKLDKLKTSEDLSNLSKSQMGNLVGYATNPTAMIGSRVLGMIGRAGPYGAAIAAAIMALISGPEIITALVKILSAPGGPLFKGFRRFIQKEIVAALNRMRQKRRELGLDQVVITQQRGYTSASSALTKSNLYRADEIRISRISNDDKAYGV